MRIQISSEKLGNPQLAELLKVLAGCFKELDLQFYVIGATARDIVMRQLMDVSSSRRTQDLDIAVAINDWERFEEIAEVLKKAGLSKSPHLHQQFYYKDYELDVVPFGDVAKADDNIYWPPEEDIAMSVKGFDNVLADAITVSMDNEYDIKLASLHGLWLLKFNAWMDRHLTTDKDAVDMSFIIDNYFISNSDRCVHMEVYDHPNFSSYLAGGIWLAYDVASLLSNEQLIYYRDCIRAETDKEEESTLINQILENDKALTYEQVFDTWKEIASVFDNTIKASNDETDD